MSKLLSTSFLGKLTGTGIIVALVPGALTALLVWGWWKYYKDQGAQAVEVDNGESSN